MKSIVETAARSRKEKAMSKKVRLALSTAVLVVTAFGVTVLFPTPVWAPVEIQQCEQLEEGSPERGGCCYNRVQRCLSKCHGNSSCAGSCFAAFDTCLRRPPEG
jgi:hypothetical protein